jgi:hypothetical protein
VVGHDPVKLEGAEVLFGHQSFLSQSPNERPQREQAS